VHSRITEFTSLLCRLRRSRGIPSRPRASTIRIWQTELDLNSLAKTPDVPDVLVCVKCARVIVFELEGWIHREESGNCPTLVVAWPPPEVEGEEAAHDAV